ncbi:MAG: hypothetical protein GF333_00870 [Candidatus Omnitrophica bacterium]|nr:hypothetical protein [Candidatus Omnitrophota bacterium]
MKRVIGRIIAVGMCVAGCALQGARAAEDRGIAAGELPQSMHITYSVIDGHPRSAYGVHITEYGDVMVEESGCVSPMQECPYIRVGRLSEKEFDQLKALVHSADVFSLKDEYIGSERMLGWSSIKITFTLDGRTKDILVSTVHIPPNLNQVIHRIETIREAVQ